MIRPRLACRERFGDGQHCGARFRCGSRLPRKAMLDPSDSIYLLREIMSIGPHTQQRVSVSIAPRWQNS
jgi:hypothetical protein